MLHLLFGPAMAVMSRLRFSLKLGLIGALFMVLLAAVAYFLNGEIAGTSSSPKPNALGVQQLVPARHLLQAIQAHRRTSAHASPATLWLARSYRAQQPRRTKP